MSGKGLRDCSTGRQPSILSCVCTDTAIIPEIFQRAAATCPSPGLAWGLRASAHSPIPTEGPGSGRGTSDVVALLLLAPHHPAAPVLSHGTHQPPASILPEQLQVLEQPQRERSRV